MELGIVLLLAISPTAAASYVIHCRLVNRLKMMINDRTTHVLLGLNLKLITI